MHAFSPRPLLLAVVGLASLVHGAAIPRPVADSPSRVVVGGSDPAASPAPVAQLKSRDVVPSGTWWRAALPTGNNNNNNNNNAAPPNTNNAAPPNTNANAPDANSALADNQYEQASSPLISAADLSDVHRERRE